MLARMEPKEYRALAERGKIGESTPKPKYWPETDSEIVA